MKFKSETELASVIISWLKESQWEVFQEVQPHTYGASADIVAKQGKVSWIIETKLTFGLAVIEQAAAWLHMANFVSVGVPYSRRGFAEVVCSKLGIGVLRASPVQYGYSTDILETDGTMARVKPEANILKFCKEPHKDFAAAGNNNGHRYTPFTQTCRNVLSIVAANPGILYKDLLPKLDHHYASLKTARACILQWGHAGKIRGVEFRKEGKLITLWPEELKKLSAEQNKNHALSAERRRCSTTDWSQA